ncbi:hypothetical protein K503DRAFT_777259, partial [Rhizopogon vinicolor AM-OR11-026]
MVRSPTLFHAEVALGFLILLDIQYIHALLQANPTLYLDELQEQLFAARDKYISLSTISR